MKSFKNDHASQTNSHIYKYANILQSKDGKWMDRNVPNGSETEDDFYEPIEEDIRD